MTRAGCIAALISLVALVGCGRVGFEPVDEGAQAGPARDARVDSDADPGGGTDDDAGLADAGEAADDAGTGTGPNDCEPACRPGYICCSRACYPTSEPVPC